MASDTVVSGMLLGMSPKLSSQILVLLSIAYGVTVALLAVLGAGRAVGLFAFIGASVLGLLWVARSFFMKRPTGDDQA
ncbi:MAG TPA: hypothetical protein VGR21_04025 [Cryptosporangiaceae bacterium]|nr:hypothetical protein [Cryptosporangiaceae bacterium]